jgi:hypothetical protein
VALNAKCFGILVAATLDHALLIVNYLSLEAGANVAEHAPRDFENASEASMSFHPTEGRSARRSSRRSNATLTLALSIVSCLAGLSSVYAVNLVDLVVSNFASDSP